MHTQTHTQPAESIKYNLLFFVVEHIVSVKIALYWILHQEAHPLFVA